MRASIDEYVLLHMEELNEHLSTNFIIIGGKNPLVKIHGKVKPIYFCVILSIVISRIIYSKRKDAPLDLFSILLMRESYTLS